MIDFKNAGKEQTEFLKDAFLHKKIAHSYLFVDPMQVKGIATAYWLACLFNCTGENKPDGTCNECQRILSGNHPDVFLVDSDGKKTLSIDQVRPLKQELSKSPVEGNRRFFFIKDAEKLTLAANNALLNLLEEPVAPVVTILITNNENQILPTVRSRTQIISFENEKIDSLKSALLEYGLTADEIEELGNTDSLEQEVKYLYQELFEHNDLALVRAYHLAQSASLAKQKFVFYWLKSLCLQDLDQHNNVQQVSHLLDLLIQCDKMQTSNVSFINCLDYLVLNF
ncbi:DNA polymerase III subunit delta [Lactobacillus hominis]|uniref:DNA polymerase III delta subunit n=1 Tax=Lactobacillus hominis DSM 23910 = CRBIP 24.179 TaxID=1423758 RepID=I7L953_9LACO|nr:DNA polymerase III subunit delta [Lactobacillus hominis]KRM85429.1 DNA polymerase III delta subunit [Lactobacillus hominis DSM 23910 = CRBIP 24.179]MCT3347494.1 DNA polymerase III subunit delta [Lactobacillus hominis]CCI81154.1 DNA polymerase III delta subunit [Lactobacillus hominis DSM 23910 = CRBIP 24.179]